jgi:glycosyltransferase involved in cell wall biosynthesis
MNQRRTFTVFTPTYNRAHTLPRVYKSLKDQTFKNYEWLIVDDGSIDGTGDLVKTWQKEGAITIRYFYQENRGKHIAINRGVSESYGELFLFTDSDDWLVPHALERLAFYWNDISEPMRETVSGITFLCMYSDGKIVGTCFPAKIIIANPISFAIQYKIKGDKKGFHRTDILKRYPFPDFPEEKFVPEGLIWNRISRDYKICFVNEALETVEYQQNGLSASGMLMRMRNPSGVREYNLEFTRMPISLRHRIKAFINYFRYSAHGRVPVRVALRDIGQPITGLFFLPVGYLFYLADRWKIH